MTDTPIETTETTEAIKPVEVKCPDCGKTLQRLTAGHRKSRWHRAHVEPKELAEKGYVQTDATTLQLREHGIECVITAVPSRYDHGKTAPATYAGKKHIAMYEDYRASLASRIRRIYGEYSTRRVPLETAIRELYVDERKEKISVEEECRALFVRVLEAEKTNAWTPELLEARRQFQAGSVESSMDQETEE